MITLKGKTVFLRALEPEDLDFIYEIENNEAIWNVSNTNTPYSKFLIRQYLENAHQDIFEAKQLRLVICKKDTSHAIGLIDLFDFDPKNNRAGVGIIIQENQERNLGFGSESLALLIDYSFSKLNLHQLFANIDPNNSASVKLFTKFDFQNCGSKKDWNLIGNRYHEEHFYQLINSNV
jgi:diamine N-acetyltransferase